MVKTKEFLKLFDRVCEAPDAVGRLRKFVLDLAVRGKLVEQDANDEPVERLLRRIENHRALLATEGKPRDAITITPLRADDGPFAVPSTWAWVHFGEVMISRDSERIPVSKDERSGRAKTYDYYGASGVIDKIDKYLFDKPLLLIGEDGANLVSRSTPIAFIARGKYWVNNHAHVLDGISEEFLEFIELHINAIDLKPYVTGTAQPKMNQAKMNSIPIALPPLPEQHRIVAKVNELMSLCDQLEAAQKDREARRDALSAASLQRLNNPDPDARAFRAHARFHLNILPRVTARPEQVKLLRQTILNLAVRGKLVRQDPGDESAGVLLGRIREEQQKLIHDRVLRPQDGPSHLTGEDTPFDVPPSWAWTQLRHLLVFGPQNGISPKPTSRPDAPRAITLTATTKGVFDPNQFKTVEANIPPDSEFWLRPGDLLFQRGNTREYVGMAAYYTGAEGQLLYPDLMMKVRLSDEVDLQYVHLCAIAPYGRAYFSEKASGAQATMPKINQGTLVQLPVPLPPLLEQQRIVTKVNELMSLCDQHVDQMLIFHDVKARLLESALWSVLKNGNAESVSAYGN
jgi:type I restriction enzyme S subunit